MKSAIRFRLSTMMFLNFFIWGAWYVTMGTYLKSIKGVTDVQVGIAYGTQSLGAIIAPFFVGLIADKFFSAQKILGVLHLGGAAALYYLTIVDNFSAFYPGLLIYMILFMPTLALINAVSFNQVGDPEKDFAKIRVWGTIGWIVAGLIIGWMAWEQTNSLVLTFRLAAAVSFIMGLFSFTLPDTPPTKAGTKVTFGEIIGLDAIGLLKDRNFLIFFLSSLLICIPLAFYYQETNIFLNELKVQGAAGKMALGQMSELVFMILMPFFFVRLGVKKMLLFGMAAWAARYLFFGFGNTGSGMWMLYAGIILHGVCYDFFFVTGQIYTNDKAGDKFRASAQGMITLATYGVGMLIGFWVAGLVAEKYSVADGHDWKNIWMIPAAISAVVFILYAVFFRDDKRKIISESEAEKGLATSPVT
ncbi:nucleoside permease [Segetibacter koreensis]|uniref:nucleoside permease n=1 Tax=Segetibacter koreensis TaxID=398037 RepID=UPI000370347F|nr:nucleoside permease [Segetibacter koreensis]